MMTFGPAQLFIVAAAITLGQALPAAQTYTVIDLGALGSGSTHANGINANGDIVGDSETPTHGRDGFLYGDGELIDLGTLGGSLSYAQKINNLGQIVGEAQDRFQTGRAFLWQDGEMVDLGALEGGCCSRALAINDAGQVAGDSDTRVLPHAFLYTDGAMTDLGTFGGPRSQTAGMDVAGHVVGTAELPDRRPHAFLYCAGMLLDLNDLIPADSGWELLGASSINDVGQIVGSGLQNGQHKAFLYQDGEVFEQPGGGHINNWGEMVGTSADPWPPHAVIVRGDELVDLNTLIPQDSGWSLDFVQDINDAGQIVGWGKHQPFVADRAFLLTPIDPEGNRAMQAQRRRQRAAQRRYISSTDLCPSLPVVALR